MSRRIPYPLGRPFVPVTKHGNPQPSCAAKTPSVARQMYAATVHSNWPALYEWGVRIVDARTGEAITESHER